MCDLLYVVTTIRQAVGYIDSLWYGVSHKVKNTVPAEIYDIILFYIVQVGTYVTTSSST